MGRLWSEESKYGAWLRVELAVCDAYTRRGRIPPDAMARIRRPARVDIARILAIQERVNHEMIALLRSLERLRRARQVVAVGKLAGAVGTFAHGEPELEAEVCRELGLEAALVSTQIVQRDRHAEFCAMLAVAAASLETIALEVRGLQRTEILEAQEPFGEGQKGSSAMPHKRNPG